MGLGSPRLERKWRFAASLRPLVVRPGSCGRRPARRGVRSRRQCPLRAAMSPHSGDVPSGRQCPLTAMMSPQGGNVPSGRQGPLRAAMSLSQWWCPCHGCDAPLTAAMPFHGGGIPLTAAVSLRGGGGAAASPPQRLWGRARPHRVRRQPAPASPSSEP